MEYAVDCINSAVKRLRSQYIRDGYYTKGLENDYAMGFIDGLRAKYEEQRKANQKWELVLVKDEEVVEAYSQIKFRHTIDTNIKYHGYSDVYENGYEDGQKFNISDKIAKDDTDETLAIASKE